MNIEKASKNEVAVNSNMQGFEEGIDQQKELILPRAKLLQALSPELNDNENLKAGMIVDNLTHNPLPIEFIPIFKSTNFVKFNPRSSDDPNFDPAYEPGAIIWNTNDPNDERVKETEFGEDGTKPTAIRFMNFLCYFPGFEMPIMVSFGKTSFKAGQKLLSMAWYSGKSMYANKYRLKAKKVTNAELKTTYFVLDVESAGAIDEQNLSIVKGIYNSFKGKNIQTDLSDAE